MRWPWQRQQAEISINTLENHNIERWDALDKQLKEILTIVTRIDQRHYKAKASKNNGDNGESDDDFSFLRGLRG